MRAHSAVSLVATTPRVIALVSPCLTSVKKSSVRGEYSQSPCWRGGADGRSCLVTPMRIPMGCLTLRTRRNPLNLFAALHFIDGKCNRMNHLNFRIFLLRVNFCYHSSGHSFFSCPSYPSHFHSLLCIIIFCILFFCTFL